MTASAMMMTIQSDDKNDNDTEGVFQGLKERMNLCLFWLGAVDLSYVMCESVSAAHSFVALLDPVFAKEYEVKRLSFVTGNHVSFLRNCPS